jgi:hypothetical protein
MWEVHSGKSYSRAMPVNQNPRGGVIIVVIVYSQATPVSRDRRSIIVVDARKS